MQNRRRAALLLACLASLMALGHLLDPHGEFGGFETAHHDHAAHGGHDAPAGDQPGHRDHDEICGQVLPPDSGETAADVAVGSWALPESTESVGRDTRADVGNSRSPPDPVTVLQINRV
ncbi:hypothetical protein [Glycomyces salinus]|uniref:hypothetical protein n=1 Tax=Glycomyces salinus TaxID=980294 RepID=UPI0018EC4E02|nr:hypothetical protein [Glycomyces salinus]